jgi:XTP/dITP diphosphohydrolase
MANREIRFVSGNPRKIREAHEILAQAEVAVIPVTYKIEELQTADVERLVRDKALRAFDHARRPLFVEHTGLHLAHLNGLPGGLTQVFWDTLEADRFANLFGASPDPTADAVTTIGYVDGQRFHSFAGAVRGVIAPVPRGPRDFQWDCVFIPDGAGETFAEMGQIEKNAISMRRKALDHFAAFLGEGS